MKATLLYPRKFSTENNPNLLGFGTVKIEHGSPEDVTYHKGSIFKSKTDKGVWFSLRSERSKKNGKYYPIAPVSKSVYNAIQSCVNEAFKS